MRKRMLTVFMFILLFIGAVHIVDIALKDERKELVAGGVAADFEGSIPLERGVFTHAEDAIKFKEMPTGTKELKDYYENRAYPGAPPTIPHPVDVVKGIGDKSCLQCHKNGGFVAKFDAYAPITPHAEMINCKQCHVPKNTSSLFRNSNWTKVGASQIRQSALEGSPPIIPHGLDMRSNCLSCHGGASAPKEIRVSHPERINCRQCHVPKTVGEVFERSVSKKN